MTRFMMDITGKFGSFWKRDAMREIMDMRQRYINGEIIIEDDGAVKWVSSGNYLPEDCAEMLDYALYEYKDPKIDLEATAKKRDAQTAKFLEEYRNNPANYVVSDEERYEIECAFGKGATVVDVITGQKITV